MGALQVDSGDVVSFAEFLCPAWEMLLADSLLVSCVDLLYVCVESLLVVRALGRRRLMRSHK